MWTIGSAEVSWSDSLHKHNDELTYATSKRPAGHALWVTLTHSTALLCLWETLHETASQTMREWWLSSTWTDMRAHVRAASTTQGGTIKTAPLRCFAYSNSNCPKALDIFINESYSVDNITLESSNLRQIIKNKWNIALSKHCIMVRFFRPNLYNSCKPSSRWYTV